MNKGIEFLRVLTKDGEEVRWSRQGDALTIDCRGCGLTPLPGSEECIRCMVGSMCEAGGARRIVLRTGMDVEVSGAAAEAVREIASLRRWSTSGQRTAARCRSCPMSRDRVMTAVWNGFPRNAVFEGRKALDGQHPGRDGCEECVKRTTRALDQVEAWIWRVVSEMGESG